MAAIEMAEGDFSSSRKNSQKIRLTRYIVERFPLGYPQFSALIGAHPTFSVSQRFSIVRARLLLVKQQRVMTLEKKLEELDLQEPQALNLGSIQADTNHARTKILKDLDEALADYGESTNETPLFIYTVPSFLDDVPKSCQYFGVAINKARQALLKQIQMDLLNGTLKCYNCHARQSEV